MKDDEFRKIFQSEGKTQTYPLCANRKEDKNQVKVNDKKRGHPKTYFLRRQGTTSRETTKKEVKRDLRISIKRTKDKIITDKI